MRGEVDGDGSARGQSKLLLDLGHMAVTADAVRRQPLARFGEQNVLLERAPGAGNARLGVDDDVLACDQFRLGERKQRKQHGGGIAAGTGHQPRRTDLVAVVLGKPVHRRLDQLGGAMLVGVPLGVEFRIAQPEIR